MSDTKTRPPTSDRSVVRRFGVSVLAVAVVLAFRLSLSPLLGHGSPFLLFVPAVMLAAWYGGLWLGLLATAMSAAVGIQFLPTFPAGSRLEEWDRLALFLVVGTVVTWHQVRVASASDRIKALLSAAEAARSEAETANAAKAEFLARVSHELRGPLSVIVGWAAMLRQTTDPSSIRKAADVTAGGVEALQRFFSGLRPDLGLAYVVILHLAPDHKSELPGIIGRWTTMPVSQVGDHDQQKLTPDHVYVIGPDRQLVIADGSGPALDRSRAARAAR